jgi:hypothetical protein
MPQHASLTGIATLKNDAYRAQTKQEWDLAQRLWIRVITAASGQDVEAIEALQNIGIQRHTRTTPPQTKQHPFTKTPESFVSARSETPYHPTPIPQTNQPFISRPLTRQQFLIWAIPAGIGVVGVTIASQFPRSQSQQSLPLQSPSPLPKNWV